MSLAFNYIFEPFHQNFNEQKISYFWICFVHALTAPIVLLKMSVLWSIKNPEEKWNIKKEIIFLITFLLLVGIFQFLIRDIVYENPNNWSFNYLFEEIRNTFLVGMLFIIIIIPWNFTRLNSKYRKTAYSIDSKNKKRKKSIDTIIEIPTNSKDELFTIDLNQLLFAKAEGNYVEFYIRDEKVSKIIKRITMKELETILSQFSNFIKTHRSFLVNILYIESVSGNAQGYKIHLKNFDKTIPVSRNMIKGFDEKMKDH